MNFNNLYLPVNEVVPTLKIQLQNHQKVLLSAPPGAGKSSVVPLVLLQEEWLGNQKIILLEPRRLAAKTLAQRMAHILGEEVGETVGYRIRFESKISKNTKIEVVTEGILTRMLQNDNALEGVALVIFDEFHERNIHADVALAFCLQAQEVLRPDLKILVMSATLNLQDLQNLLQAPVVESTGKIYPVEHIYTDSTDIFSLPESTSFVIKRALQEQKGDVLVFLPGEGEIKKCASLLQNLSSDIEIHELYGALPFSLQQRAILPSSKGNRKVVLATSIAETSLTIEGITVVVDCGYVRKQVFEPKSGLSKLETLPISMDSANQRAGRAGRLQPGVCYRMWNKAQQHQLQEFRKPEILEADLASLALDLAQWGVVNYLDMPWLTVPPLKNITQAFSLLEDLGATEDGKITPHGKQMQALACHPRIAHLLIKAQEHNLTHLATDIAALLEEKDPLGREAGVDINLRIEALRKQRAQKSFNRSFGKIAKIAEQYRKLCKVEENNDFPDGKTTGFLLVHAYPERIGMARPGNNAQFQLSGGNLAMLGHKDDLANEPCLAIAHVDARDGMGKIFLASPLDPRDLSDLLKEKEVLEWNTKKGGLVASKDLRLGSLVLKSSPITQINPDKVVDVLVKVLQKEGVHLLNFSEDVVQLQNRLLFLKTYDDAEKWGDFSTEYILQNANEILGMYLRNCKTNVDVQKIDLHQILLNQLDYNLQQELQQKAPAKLEVPSGSKITLQYSTDASAPILAVRIQEIFGLNESPRINNGKNTLLLHLLSPAYKPVQITSDLANFWKSTYFEVKKELKQRYPKHAWPDNPTQHPAIKGTKKQNGL
jgi:ATP-dependent helicase HrpB